MCMCTCGGGLEGSSKCYKPYQESIDIMDHSFCGNKLPLLIKPEKLIQISILISIPVTIIQSVCEWYATNLKSG